MRGLFTYYLQNIDHERTTAIRAAGGDGYYSDDSYQLHFTFFLYHTIDMLYIRVIYISFSHFFENDKKKFNIS